MGPAKFFSALVGLGVILTAGAQSPATENCGPCSKILDPVCGIDGEDETKTFPSRCVMRWCNCMLRAADSDRSFSMLKSGYCGGDSSDETAIPECFPELEETDESADNGPTYQILNVTTAPTARVVPTSRTLNVTEVAPAAGIGPTSQTLNITEVAPAAAKGPTSQTLNITEASPAAGACLVPGAVLSVMAVVTTLVASSDL